MQTHIDRIPLDLDDDDLDDDRPTIPSDPPAVEDVDEVEPITLRGV